MPPIVASSEEGIRFLWNEVQDGIVHKALPQRYSTLQPDWRTFLYSRGYDLVFNYYGKRKAFRRHDPLLKARDEFMQLVRGGPNARSVRFERESDHRKDVGEQLVQGFAVRQRRLRDFIADHTQNQRQEWGKYLTLSSESNPGQSE